MLIIIFVIIILLIYYWLTIPLNYNIKIRYGNNTKIPKIIVTKYSENMINEVYTKNWEKMALQNPGYKIYKYNDEDVRMFLIKHFPENVVETFDKLRPGAYKADLFRFCYLYINGGVYIDYNKKLKKPLDEIIPIDADFVVAEDILNYLYTALIIIRPRHELMLKCIEGCVENTKRKYYGWNSLCPTGPGLFYKKYIQYYNFNKVRIGRIEAKGDIIYVYQHIMLKNGIFNMNGQRIMRTTISYELKKKENKNFKKYYSTLWSKKLIYKK